MYRAVVPGDGLAGIASTLVGMDPRPVAVAVVLLAAVAIACVWLASRTAHRLRLIADTPTSKARSAHQGYIELEGVARPMDGAPLTAPLTRLPCCWYRYRVEELQTAYGPRGERRRRWRVVERGASTETFWLDDGTGRVAVDPEGAELRVRHKDVWRGAARVAGINAPPSRRLPAFLAPDLRYRFTEERINPGDPVYVLGLLKNLGVDAAVPSLADRVRETLVRWKQDRAALHARFDLNRDGRIDEREWLLARQAARREAEKARAAQAIGAHDGVNLLGRPVVSGLPYLISTYTQRALMWRKRVHAWLYVAGSLVTGALALWLYNARFT